MYCRKCGSDNQEDSQFCRRCGVSLNESQIEIGSTPEKLPAKRSGKPQGAVSNRSQVPVTSPIPENATIIRQSNWAYMLGALPWVILAGASYTFDFLTFGILPITIAVLMVGSRYVGFLRTAYILTDKSLIVIRGSILGKNRADILFTDVAEITVRSGMVEGYLGYTSIILQLKDEGVIALYYVPANSTLADYLHGKIDSSLQEK